MVEIIRTIEAVAATTWFWTFSTGFLFSTVFSILLLFCPSLWWLIPLYLVWIWFDRNTCEEGGRPIKWIRQLNWWRRVNYFFQHKTICDDELRLDPKKNYLFGCFPHGIMPIGPFALFVDGYQRLFPEHNTFLTALGIQFWIPFIRELFLSVGFVSTSGPSIRHLLSNEKGGNIVSLVVGGADEAKYSQPGKYKVILNKRKGFVKLALQTGTSLVPMITFGETDVFEQLDFPGLCCIREAVKKTLQIGLVLPKGQCLICPRRVPLTTCVGDPIDVEKVENPTVEQIDALHQKFVSGLKEVFDKYKHRYALNPDSAILEIV